MDGVEAAKILKAKMEAGEIPRTIVIALSAQPLKAEDHDFFFEEAGFAAYITKPTTKSEFLAVLKRYGVI